MSPRARRASTRPPAPVPSAGGSITEYRLVWYLLSFCVPFAGILVALFLYDRDEKEVRRIGRNCLLIGFVFWVLLPLLVGFLLVVIALFSMAGWVSDVMDAAD
ncbi:MAG TPA: hypothetical protein VHE12_10295 [bacterium]|nr:hypothetical protein [bacterium]